MGLRAPLAPCLGSATNTGSMHRTQNNTDTTEGPGEAARSPEQPEMEEVGRLTEAEFGELGRTRPDAIKALLAAKEAVDAPGWQAFQSQVRADGYACVGVGCEEEVMRLGFCV